MEQLPSGRCTMRTSSISHPTASLLCSLTSRIQAPTLTGGRLTPTESTLSRPSTGLSLRTRFRGQTSSERSTQTTSSMQDIAWVPHAQSRALTLNLIRITSNLLFHSIQVSADHSAHLPPRSPGTQTNSRQSLTNTQLSSPQQRTMVPSCQLHLLPDPSTAAGQNR